MAKWTFEPGHTAAGFTARHMMVTNVRGHFKDVHGSLVFDPLKGNNTVSVKTVVEFPQITTTRTGSTLVIAWPADASAYILEHTTSLTPPAVWTPVPTPPIRVGSQNMVTVTIGSGNEFFRLRTTAP